MILIVRAYSIIVFANYKGSRPIIPDDELLLVVIHAALIIYYVQNRRYVLQQALTPVPKSSKSRPNIKLSKITIYLQKHSRGRGGGEDCH